MNNGNTMCEMKINEEYRLGVQDGRNPRKRNEPFHEYSRSAGTFTKTDKNPVAKV